MKIKIEINTEDRTQTKIIIDGKPIQNSISFFNLFVNAKEPVFWEMGFRRSDERCISNSL
ncbi:MAG: hypothetical protein J7K26_00245 [Candidatus Aenigmarchaeota archaeon]|nr:hypothetical protein [Candidatus Aenigmarchaeota archaeon]